MRRRLFPPSTRNWLMYALSMLVFGVLIFSFLRQQNAAAEAVAKAAAEQELRLLRLAVQQDLERSQYRAASDLVQAWGLSGTEVVRLRLLAVRGEVIAEYQRAQPATQTLALSDALEYSYTGRATLQLQYDLAPTLAGEARLAAGLISLYLLAALASGFLVHLNQSRQQALKRLRQTTEQLDSYFNNSLDLFCIGEVAGSLRKVNPRWTDVLGYAVGELEGKPLLNFVHPDDQEQTRSMLARLAQQQSVASFTNRIRHKDGSYRSIEWVVRPHNRIFFAAARDITEREERESEIRFLNRIYSTLSETNQLIVRCQDETTLFESICRIAVEFGGMKLAWIGKEEQSTARIKPVASYGERTHYLPQIATSSRADSPEGRGPVGIAFREGKTTYVNDFERDPRLAYWREHHGPQWAWGSMASIPVRREGKPYAVLSFYDTVAHSFTGKILDVLREMALDIEYALVRLDLEAHKRRADAELRVAAIAFESQEAMLVTDAKGNILRVNGAFTKTTGYTQDEVLGRNPSLLQSGRHSKAFFAQMWEQLTSTGRWQGEVWDKRKSGEIYPKWLGISTVYSPNGEVSHFVGSFTDISERKEAAAAISRLAYYDSLTELPNRQLMMDRLKQALLSSARSGTYGALLFLDLDRFKTINDTLGHVEGDKLLQEAAQRLRTCVREEDTVARFGGDEFVVLLENLEGPRERAAVLAKGIGDKLLAALAQPYRLRSKEYSCSASIGVVLWRGGPTADVHELLKRSDMAMYEAKKAGRNSVRFFDPIMQTTIENRARLEARLRKGLELGQFQLHFQGQVGLRDELLGAEALLRWNDPERGMVSPAEFIPLAEESDLIVAIGRWVLESACQRLQLWSRSPVTRDLRLAVNISPKQFSQEWFVSEVAEIINRSGANPTRLQLEITEGMLLRNVEEAISKMGQLRKLGVSFALDDFGTGYSSLAYLQRLPINILKLDQSFVRDLGIDQRSDAIARTVIQMGQSLGLDVLAEGVETEQQRRLLEERGCSKFQGYLFGYPVPIERFCEEFGLQAIA